MHSSLDALWTWKHLLEVREHFRPLLDWGGDEVKWADRQGLVYTAVNDYRKLVGMFPRCNGEELPYCSITLFFGVEETCDHLYFDCPYSGEVFKAMKEQLGLLGGQNQWSGVVH
ncbi:hypothetical protein Ancab_025286 [Ancistrocladus abbreviatus]